MVNFGFLMLGIPIAALITALAVREIRRELGDDGATMSTCVLPSRDMLAPYFGTLALCLAAHLFVSLLPLWRPQPAINLSHMLGYGPLLVDSIYLGLLAGIVFPSNLWLIPNVFTLSGILTAPLVALAIPGALTQQFPIAIEGLISCLLGIAVCFAIPFAIDRLGMRVLNKQIFGLGTIKHLALAGALLGPVNGLACLALFAVLIPVVGFYRRDAYVPTGFVTTLSAFVVYAGGNWLLALFA